jgi:hypothetical protein
MKKITTFFRLTCLSALLMGVGVSANAQTTPPTEKTNAANDTATFKPGGQLWGYTFGDFEYKGNSDVLNRGGSNQYTGQPAQTSAFQFRRIYLGYNYNISPKFSAEFLLAAEDDFNAGLINQSAGDVLQNGKFSPYVKLANIRWKNIWKGTDLVIGQAATPAFPLLSEVVWGYRSVERTISDIRRTPSYDMGATLQGHFDNKANFGYDLMVGNGTSAKPETDGFKWFYGDVFAKFFNQRLIIDLYQDYEKLNWSAITNGQAETATTTTTGGVSTTTYGLPASPAGFHHDRNMTKLFIAYTVPKVTFGIEAFQNTILGDVQAVNSTTHKVYYLTSKAMAASFYVRGRIYKDKLGFFARYDMYNPSLDLGEFTNNKEFTSYKALTSTYDPTTKEQFVTCGIDFTPFPNVHLMPNIWMDTYKCALPSDDFKSSINPAASGALGTDMVYRLTFYYIFGKKEGVRF